jgi:hypothetical protein
MRSDYRMQMHAGSIEQLEFESQGLFINTPFFGHRCLSAKTAPTRTPGLTPLAVSDGRGENTAVPVRGYSVWNAVARSGGL